MKNNELFILLFISPKIERNKSSMVLVPVQLLKSSLIGFFSLALQKIPAIILEELHEIGTKTPDLLRT
ncbi:hypothetical protein HYY69_00210 [Candidatus Woesearchaeota archaeon]|nr:hypothetical protein [Candidatus Woesearchaeota archaeon]